MARVEVKYQLEVPDDLDSDLLGQWLNVNFCESGILSEELSQFDIFIENKICPVYGTFDWDYV